jgi:hypothetical protein
LKFKSDQRFNANEQPFIHPARALPMPAPPTPWRFVRQRFTRALDNLKITEDQAQDGRTKLKGVVACLNRAYWDISDGRANRVLIGSWAKQTRTRPPRDVDLLFILPVEVYYRFQQRQGNIQSQLLQELRDIIRITYPPTDIRGDGQVVVVRFNTYQVEVAPAFHRQGGGYLACDTNGGGCYKHVDPAAELAAFTAADTTYNGNVRKLTRLLKQWQRHCTVAIKSFHLEALAKGVLPTINYGGADEFWFDWIVRDAFGHLTRCGNDTFVMPGTGEVISVGDEWRSRAISAYDRAVKACGYEYNNQEYLAGIEWQKIFGPMIPMAMT